MGGLSTATTANAPTVVESAQISLPSLSSPPSALLVLTAEHKQRGGAMGSERAMNDGRGGGAGGVGRGAGLGRGRCHVCVNVLGHREGERDFCW